MSVLMIIFMVFLLYLMSHILSNNDRERRERWEREKEDGIRQIECTITTYDIVNTCYGPAKPLDMPQDIV